MHGTIAYLENPISEIEVSDYLFSKGYEISPQQLKATWFFVAMVDSIQSTGTRAGILIFRISFGDLKLK
ncbi:hypothetical protein JHC27_02390 [archaeon]|nr:hypothetical protein [archaeon]